MENQRHNFRANVWDGAFYTAGLAFVAGQTILPVFAQRLGASNVVIGLIPGLLMATWLLPQLVAANYTQGLTYKKPYIARLGLGQRLIWLLLAGLTLLLPPHLLLVAFLLLYVGGGLADGMAGPAWVDLVSRVTPVDRRGALFAGRKIWGNALAFLAALASHQILMRTPFPQNYALLFTLAFFCLMVSFAFFIQIRETPTPGVREPQSLPHYLSSLPKILQVNVNYRWYLMASALISLGTMATAFYTVAGISRLGLPTAAAASFTMALTAGQWVGSLLCGRLADRFGHRLNILIYAGCGFSAAFFALWGPPLPGLYLLFFLLGLALAAQVVSEISFVVELGTPEECPTYVGIANTWLGPFILLAPVLGGWVADHWGYPWVFFLAAISFAAGGLLLLAKVSEPRQRSPRVQTTTI